MTTLMNPSTAALLSILLFGGCASSPPVEDAEFANVRAAINEAEAQDATKYSGRELLDAERKLQQARGLAGDDPPTRCTMPNLPLDS